MSHISKAIDEVRAEETTALKSNGKAPVLTGSSWCLLTPAGESHRKTQGAKLKELLACNLRTVRAYLLKEDFQWFWSYTRTPLRP